MSNPNALTSVLETTRLKAGRIAARMAVGAVVFGVAAANLVPVVAEAQTTPAIPAKVISSNLNRLSHLQKGVRLNTLSGKTTALVAPAGATIYERVGGKLVKTKLNEQTQIDRALYVNSNGQRFAFFNNGDTPESLPLSQPNLQEFVFDNATSSTGHLQPFNVTDIRRSILSVDLVHSGDAYHHVNYKNRDALHVDGQWVERLAQAVPRTD